MTYAEERGLRVGDKIVYTGVGRKGNHNVFATGNVLELVRDDNSKAPEFRSECGDTSYFSLRDRDWFRYEEVHKTPPTPVTRGTKLSIEMTVEEAIAVFTVLGTIAGRCRLRKMTSNVYHKLDGILTPICETTDVISYLNVPGINADCPSSGSFEALLEAMLPDTAKQKAQKELDELLQLAEVKKKQIQDMKG